CPDAPGDIYCGGLVGPERFEPEGGQDVRFGWDLPVGNHVEAGARVVATVAKVPVPAFGRGELRRVVLRAFDVDVVGRHDDDLTNLLRCEWWIERGESAGPVGVLGANGGGVDQTDMTRGHPHRFAGAGSARRRHLQ